MSNQESKILLESADAARVLDLSAPGVHRLTRTGVLMPVAKTPRGTRLYDPADVARVAAERKASR